MMINLRNIFFIIICLLLIPGKVLSVEKDKDLRLPVFNFQKGWLGGDAAYSVELSENRTLWLFGDTFINLKNPKSRTGAAIISNTIAISTFRNNKREMEYFFFNKNGNPQPFFSPAKNDYRFWPLHGFVYREKLYLALERIKNVSKDGIFDFEGVGVDLAVISNPEENPDKWKVGYQPLVTGKSFFPGISTVIDGDYVYLFAVIDDEKHKQEHPIVLSRIALNNLDDAAANLEFLDNSHRWETALDPENTLFVLDKGATEMSIRYHSGLKKWLAIYTGTEFLSNEIIMRTSENLEGPWSNPTTIYKVPEMDKKNKNYDKDTFCYAAKEHKQFSSLFPDKLFITYACNSFEFGKLFNNNEIYRPKTMLIQVRE
jgi:hypothetical protein